MRTLAVVNQKGGTGKTTTAVNLAAGFARRGYWVLLVDLDPQGSAGYSLGLDAAAAPATLAKSLLEGLPLVQAIRPTPAERIEMVLGGAELATLELRIKNPLTAVRALGRLLEPVAPAYDLCVLDAPPSLSLTFTNALSAAQALLVPVTPSYLSAKGLEALLATIEEARADLNLAPELLGFVLTMVDRRLGLDREVEGNLRQVFGQKVFAQVVRLNVRVKEAPGHFRTIFAHAPDSAGAEDYAGLAGEVLARMGLPAQVQPEAVVAAEARGVGEAPAEASGVGEVPAELRALPEPAPQQPAQQAPVPQAQPLAAAGD